MKKAILCYLEKYFNYWHHKTGLLPSVPFDGEFNTELYIGEVNKYGYIQWIYQENTKKFDFGKLEKEIKIILREEIKEYLNSYKFLELLGFLNEKLVYFDAINDVEDSVEKIILQHKYIKEIEKSADSRDLKALESCIEIGSYQGIFELYFDNENGNIVIYDFDWHRKTVIADTFEGLFENLRPNKKENFEKW